MLQSINMSWELNKWTLIVYYKLQQNMAESIIRRIHGTLNAATFWINYVTSRQCITVDGKHVSITK